MSLQPVLNGIIAASWYALVGLGFALALRVNGFLNIGQAALFTLAGYATFLLKEWLGVPLVPAIGMAVPIAALAGVGIEFLIYEPLRRRRASPVILLLASLGIYIVFQNAVSLMFGDDTKILRPIKVAEGFGFLGARVSSVQFASVLSTAFIVVLPIIISTVPRFFEIDIGAATVEHFRFMIVGALIIFFLIVEPAGLARLWQITREKLRLWPFPY